VKAREGFSHLLKTDASFLTKVQKGFDKMMPDSFERSPPVSRRTEQGREPVGKTLERRMEVIIVS
jgi:hypothetical protein